MFNSLCAYHSVFCSNIFNNENESTLLPIALFAMVRNEHATNAGLHEKNDNAGKL